MIDNKDVFLLLYDVAISIDTSLDIDRLKKTFFMKLLKKMNCNALIFHDKRESYYESIPRPYLQSSNIKNVILSKWSENSSYIQWGDEYKYHVLNIPNLGFIFLEKSGNAIPDLILNMLSPILEKFSLAYNACLHKQALEIEKNKAEKSNQVKTTFLAVVSHEIRTPLNGIVGMLGLLGETKLSKEQQNFINKMKYSSETLLVLLNDILEYTTIGETNINFQYKKTNIREFIDNCVSLIRSSYNQNHNTIMVSIDEKIPEMVNLERARLGQLLFNLISNSCKFTHNGKVKLDLKLDQKGIKYSIADTGIGISEERIKEAFQPFNQENLSKTRTHSGTGLGLPISKKLVSLMNSFLFVESVVGEGACFYFTLPLKKISNKNYDREIKIPSTATTLVAEDNDINRELLVTILKKMNIETDIAINGQDAVDKCSKHNYGLVFMDMRMPILDGVSASKIILSKSPDTKIVAISANTSEEDIANFYHAGIEDFISKPYKISRIKETVNRILNK